MGRYQRTVLGVLATLAGLGVLLAILLPLRPHVSIVVPALLFVLPALLGVVLGGFVPGAVGALGGFFFYDYFFLPPYNTLTVRSPQNWVASAGLRRRGPRRGPGGRATAERPRRRPPPHGRDPAPV